ncbi:hypothetical protein ACEPAF_6602 [Sanghuangporus sanghuang]
MCTHLTPLTHSSEANHHFWFWPVVMAGDAPQTPTGRKRPCCTKCGNLMFGHKRGQCSAAPTPTRVKVEDFDEPGPGHVTEQLASLNINQDKLDGEGVPEAKRLAIVDERRRSLVRTQKLPKAETLVSLNSDAKAVLETLGKPGMMSKDVVVDESAARAKIENWLDAVPASDTPKRSRQKYSTGPPIKPLYEFDAMLDLPLKDNESAKKRTAARLPKRLGRTSSAADREEFFEQLAQKSKKPVASVFTIEMTDIPELEEKARQLRFHARVIAPKYADGSTGEGWLVVGKDEESVKEVFAQVEKDVKSGFQCGYMGRLGDFAAGAVITWTILAYS